MASYANTLTTYELPDDLEECNRVILERGWSDGLPVIPPTLDRVDRFLDVSGYDPDLVLGQMPPIFCDVSVAAIAVNAVMAGARPEYFRIIVAAVRAMLEPRVNLFGIQATTHSCGVMVMANGPAAKDAGINSGAGVFGPGFHANATIGRAIRLVLCNIGGAKAADGTDRSTQGSPAKFSFCFAENEEESPWEPHHVSVGFDIAQSTVTVVGAEAPHNIDDHASRSPDALLRTVSHSIATIGKNNAYIRDSDYFVGFGPEHAQFLAAGGWSKSAIQKHLFETARIPHAIWSGAGLFGIFPQPAWIDEATDGTMIPMSDRAEDVRVIVAGGPGRHSCFIPTIAIGRSATVVVE